MDLKETDILGESIDTHWYYISKAKMLKKMTSSISDAKILDIGAGSAFFSKYLLSNTNATECVCIDTSYARDHEELIQGKPIAYRQNPSSYQANLVLLMDVLEHIEDDIAFLKDYVKHLPSGTHFFITVPAFQFLWSGHDIYLEHKRRYTIGQLREVVKKAGLVTEKQFYFYGLIFPIACITRLLGRFTAKQTTAHSQLKKHHPITNFILSLLCRLEMSFMQLNTLAGLSVVCYAKKP